MHRFIAGCGLCCILACSSPERQHETKKQQYPLRYHPNRGIPVDKWRDTERASEPELDSKPVQVTTRSGSLRQTGPEPFVPLDQSPNPTFAPEEAPAPLARRFSSEIPQGNRAPVRESRLSRAGQVSPEDKPTMSSWLRGLWTGKKTPASKPAAEIPPVTSAPQAWDKAASDPGDQSTSIDPNRVFRGPKPPQQSTEGTRGSHFSESGVPRSTNEFRGRQDSAF